MEKLFTLRKRKEFLRVAKEGFKMVTSTIILTAAQNFCADNETQVGFTATKKIGKATVRNRAKRRLRALTRTNLGSFLPQTDYVLIARFNTAECEYNKLEDDFKFGLKKLNKLLEENDGKK
ncbi:MAG: ribonuclease P protein component [Lactobacillus sp.]|nr:ribonuclease P protein component [Lactobacillus sp.]